MTDGLMQNVTFVDGHCVRHVRRASRNVLDNLVCVMFAERHGVLDSSTDSAEKEGCLVSV